MVYTDGSRKTQDSQKEHPSTCNGGRNTSAPDAGAPVAGCGIHFASGGTTADGQPAMRPDISFRFDGDNTIMRAELAAIHQALKEEEHSPDLTIATDSLSSLYLIRT